MCQGLPFGFFTQAMPIVLRQNNASLKVIGFSALLSFPWFFKFLWGPFFDRFYFKKIGRRKSWILPLQALTIGLCFFLATLDVQKNTSILFLAFFLSNLLASLQDVATDAFAVENLKDEERGFGNGIQVAGYRVGMIIGGAALLYFFDVSGWSMTMYLMAAIIFINSLLILFYKEKTKIKGRKKINFKNYFLNFKEFLMKKGVKKWVVILLVYKIGDALGSIMLKPMMVDVGYSTQEIALYVGTIAFMMSLGGALIGGLVINKIGRFRSLYLFGFFHSFVLASYALIKLFPANRILGVGVIAIEHFVGSMLTVSLFTLMMYFCSKENSATEYSLQASLVVMATGVFSSLSGVSADFLGYVPHYLLCGVIGVFSFAFIYAQSQSEDFRFLKLHS